MQLFLDHVIGRSNFSIRCRVAFQQRRRWISVGSFLNRLFLRILRSAAESHRPGASPAAGIGILLPDSSGGFLCDTARYRPAIADSGRRNQTAACCFRRIPHNGTVLRQNHMFRKINSTFTGFFGFRLLRKPNFHFRHRIGIFRRRIFLFRPFSRLPADVFFGLTYLFRSHFRPPAGIFYRHTFHLRHRISIFFQRICIIPGFRPFLCR